MEGGSNPGKSAGSSNPPPPPPPPPDPRAAHRFQLRLAEVQNILDQNNLLINEINQNHQSRLPENLRRNVILIRELNNNLRRVTEIYALLPSYLLTSREASLGGGSTMTKSSGKGRGSQKRQRPG